MPAINRIGEWLGSMPKATTELACRNIQNAFRDTIGCIIAGLNEPSVLAAASLVRRYGTGSARALPDIATLAPWAALLNGTAAHAIDFDDGENVAFTHASAVLVPALLALGCERRRSGAELLDAYAAGYDVLIRFGQWIGLDHYRRGWHSTSTVGAVGAAAACARLLELNAIQAGHALSIASSMAGGFRSQFGSMTKALHAGLAAKAGVMASGLAEAGMTGSDTALDGSLSFSELMVGAAPARPFGGRSPGAEPLAIETMPPMIKLYPSCGATHGSLEAALTLMDEYRFGAKDIERVETELPDVSFSALTHRRPADATEARFNLEHCLAAALIDGELRLAAFEQPALGDARIRELARKIQVTPYPGEHAYQAGSYIVRTRIMLRGGRELSREVFHRKGSPQRPLAQEELVRKFLLCTSGVWGLRDEQAFLDELANFGKLRDVATFLGQLGDSLYQRGSC